MKKRDIAILAGLGVVVLIAAWYFLLLKPKQDDLSKTQDQLTTDQQNSRTIKRRSTRSIPSAPLPGRPPAICSS